MAALRTHIHSPQSTPASWHLYRRRVLTAGLEIDAAHFLSSGPRAWSEFRRSRRRGAMTLVGSPQPLAPLTAPLPPFCRLWARQSALVARRRWPTATFAIVQTSCLNIVRVRFGRPYSMGRGAARILVQKAPSKGRLGDPCNAGSPSVVRFLKVARLVLWTFICF